MFKKKFPEPMDCYLCQTQHRCKTVHLHLVDGAAIVSEGVLEELKMAGMPDLYVKEVIATPPPLRISTDIRDSREKQNHTNQRMVSWRNAIPGLSWKSSPRKSQPSTMN